MKAFLLHTVQPGLITFGSLLKENFPNVETRNILDDFWLHEMDNSGGIFTEVCKNHLINVCLAIEETGAEIIICTCSSLSPHLDIAREKITIPIVAIDAKMAEITIANGKDILIIGTAETAIESAQKQLNEESINTNTECKISSLYCSEAGIIMRSGGDKSEHDRIILSMSNEMKGHDVIVLAQLSMAHLGKELEQLTGVKVLTTPMLCLEDLKNYL